MDISTFADIFTGSPYKPLLRHRKTVLEALGLLNRQMQTRLTATPQWQGRPDWLAEFNSLLEKHERSIMMCLHQPSLTAIPKDQILTMLQTQNNLAHLTGRLAERFSYRPINLPEPMSELMNNACLQFGKAIFHLRQGVAELEGLGRAGFRKQHAHTQNKVHEQLSHYIENLKSTLESFRGQVFVNGHSLNQIDVAILLLTLEDFEDLCFWMRSILIQMQPKA